MLRPINKNDQKNLAGVPLESIKSNKNKLIGGKNEY